MDKTPFSSRLHCFHLEKATLYRHSSSIAFESLKMSMLYSPDSVD